MSERANIHVLVDPEQKQRWSDFADSNAEVDNLSQLVRTAVEQYISEPDASDSNEKITDLLETVDKLHSTTQTNRNKLLEIESQTPTGQEIAVLLENEMESLLEDKLVEILSQEVDFGISDEEVDEIMGQIKQLEQEHESESE